MSRYFSGRTERYIPFKTTIVNSYGIKFDIDTYYDPVLSDPEYLFTKNIFNNYNHYNPWRINILHNPDRPAYTITKSNGTQQSGWYYNGELHCRVAPALKGVDDNNMWYIHGRPITKDFFPWCEENGVDYANPTPEDLVLVHLQWFT